MLFRPDFPFSLEIWLEPADRLNTCNERFEITKAEISMKAK